MKKKVVALLLAAVLCVGIGVGGTIAWLSDQTDTLVNTFTVGNVSIKLDEADLSEGAAPGDRTETGNTYHLVPGGAYDKDPIVYVDKASEACYVFIKVTNGLAALGLEVAETETASIKSQLASNGWTAVSGYDGYYYKEVSAAQLEAVAGAEDYLKLAVFTKFSLSTDADVGKVITTGDGKTTISVTACAIQSQGFASVADAFAACPSAFTGIAATP